MLKKFLIAIMCVAILLLFVACSKDDSHQNDGATNQTENALANDASHPSKPTEEKKSVFKTEDIIHITFYAYYGNGKGSDVPGEHLDEMIAWLDSFTLDKEVPELLPPGTNTIHVEIEYLDGTIVKRGLDTATVDGITYYIKGDTAPECYEEIVSKTSLN